MLILVTRAERKAAEEAAGAAVSAAAQVAEAHDSKAEASLTAFGASETPASVANGTHLRSAAKSTSLVTAFASKKRGTKRRRSLSPVPSSFLFGQLVAQYPESDVRFTPLLAKPHTTTSDAAIRETFFFAAPLLRPIDPHSLTTPSLLPPDGPSTEAQHESPKVPRFEGYKLGDSKRQMWAKKRAAQKAEGMKE
ncbi:hypothetical protein LTR12_009053 [Friedmanniomyces endolithicus]|nr:hypothetical protein LTR74_010889 [Friedmanniomyces endolithicus]KAK1816574.1 hypothetical protein LTR12_009053 [Friedmanniomyces endolithicus]